jgi:hypothetical protein
MVDYIKKESNFKVVDRRSVTSGDLLKPKSNFVDNVSSLKNNNIKQNKSKLKKDSSDISKNNEAVKDKQPINFSMFIQSLAHQAFICMGLFPWPDSKLIKINLLQARETIDILQMLKNKTIGNLTTEDDNLFENLLYKLKMTFINVKNSDKNLPK